MKNIYVNWLKKDAINNCQIIKGGDPVRNGLCYKEIFTKEPWNEAWTEEEAIQVMKEYEQENANIWIPIQEDKELGFLVSTDKIPEDQKDYITYPKKLIRYIEEIGVLPEYRNKNIASELVRRDLINALLMSKEYIAYRTNIMRYFKKEVGESFETAVERIQVEDKRAKEEGNKIIVPSLSKEEKQDFVNQYIEVISRREDLDVSNSTRLFNTIFDTIEFCKDGNNYTWQADPTGKNNDRIFPVANVTKSGYVKTRFGAGGIR